MIATHNSGTGEKGRSLKDKLVAPFSKCQNKTIIEQYNAGCRLFDIRINKNYRFAHGLWESKPKAKDVLFELDKICDDNTYVILTFEGKEKDMNMSYFNDLKYSFKKLKVVSINCKLPEWDTLQVVNPIQWDKEFSSATWRKWIPVPWFWAELKDVDCGGEGFVMIDFL